MRPRLLFISQVFPHPEGHGPARRAHAVICALTQTHDVWLLTITHASQDNAAPFALPPGCHDWRRLGSRAGGGRTLRWRRFLADRHPRLFTLCLRQPTAWMDHSGARLRLAAKLCAGENFDVIHAFRMVMAPYALAIQRAGRRRSIVQLDTDDIESLTLGRIAALRLKNAGPRPAAEESANARIHARLERALFRRFQRVFVCSQTDADRLARRHDNIRVLPNTVPVPASRPAAPAPAPRFRFLFLGTLNYYPNMDALFWLCRDILPRLRSACDCELLVAGMHAPQSLVDFLEAREGVSFLGTMARSADAFSAADGLLVPLRAGGGTRLKILEAFAQGRPVISTSLGIEGIVAQPGVHYLAADTVEAFVLEAARLAADAPLRRRLAKNAFELVSREYSPPALARTLAE